MSNDFAALAAQMLPEVNRIAAEVRDWKSKGENKLVSLSDRLRDLEQRAARHERYAGDGWTPGSGAGFTLGAAVTRHSDFSSAAPALRDRRGRLQLTVSRQDFSMVTSAPASGGALAVVERRVGEPVMLPRQRLTIRDLVAPGTTGGNMVQYPRQTVRDLNAAVVSEGTRKPESSISFELADAPVRTIAHWTKASRQVFDDSPALSAAIDGELTFGLQLEEEQELLFGDGTGQHLHGIVPQASAYDTARNEVGDTRFDTLAHAIAQTETALLPATGIVMNIDDLAGLRTIKGEDGHYIAQGGPFGPPITSIWGRPVVGTPAIDPGEFVVGAFRDGAQVFDRETVQVQLSTENEDDFVKNLLTILVEERLAFTVRRPQAFVYGEFPVTSG